jgi:hypothetical protein
MKRYGTLVTGLVAAIGCFSCNKIVKNTNDKTPPQVEIKVKGPDGEYQPASTVQLSATGNGQIEWLCLVSDADGVKSIGINYSASLDGCTEQGTIYDCVSDYQPKPQNLFQKLDDTDGTVLDKLPLLATVKGPFTCHCPGHGPGVPYGRSIKATCTGYNWSSDPGKQSAQKVLTINLQ